MNSVRQMHDFKRINCTNNNLEHSTSKYCYFDVADLSAKPINTVILSSGFVGAHVIVIVLLIFQSCPSLILLLVVL